MAILFLDTSALVKLYVLEQGTDRMLALAHPDAGHRLVILSVAQIEMRAAVRRRSQQGDLEPSAADTMLDELDRHLGTVFTVQPVDDAVLEHAAGVVDRHILRAYDAIQLGGFLALTAQVEKNGECLFVCADATLAAAARRDSLGLIDLGLLPETN